MDILLNQIAVHAQLITFYLAFVALPLLFVARYSSPSAKKKRRFKQRKRSNADLYRLIQREFEEVREEGAQRFQCEKIAKDVAGIEFEVKRLHRFATKRKAKPAESPHLRQRNLDLCVEGDRLRREVDIFNQDLRTAHEEIDQLRREKNKYVALHQTLKSKLARLEKPIPYSSKLPEPEPETDSGENFWIAFMARWCAAVNGTNIKGGK